MVEMKFLDPELLAPLEPSETVGGLRFSISPFEVPCSVEVTSRFDHTKITEIGFEYNGEELPRDGQRSMVSDKYGLFHLLVGHQSGKILRLFFPIPVNRSDLPLIAQSLKREADIQPKLTAKFSYLIIYEILNKWEEFA